MIDLLISHIVICRLWSSGITRFSLGTRWTRRCFASFEPLLNLTISVCQIFHISYKQCCLHAGDLCKLSR